MTKKKISIILTLVLIVGICAYFGISSLADNPIREDGKLYAESLQTPSLEQSTEQDADEPAITGKDFTVTRHVFQNMVAQNQHSGMEPQEAEQYALMQYIVRRSVYFQAVSEGFLASDEAVQQDIDYTKEASKSADNAEDYYEFIKGTGMTEDEYWASMFDTRKMLITLENYAEAKRTAFLANGHTQDDEAAWQAYCLDLTQQAIDAQEITLAEPYAWELTAENCNAVAIWPSLSGWGGQGTPDAVQ